MQYQLSNSNASTTNGRIKSDPTGSLASEKLARFAVTEATRAIQFKQARNFSKEKPEAGERIRLIETALRAATQECAPRASSGNRHGDGQPSTATPSSGANRFTKLHIVALISVAFVLPTLGMAVSLGVTPLADMSQRSPFIPSPVLTAPAYLEAAAGENILLPIALDGTDGVPAHSSIGITGLPQGSTLSKGRPFGDTGWKLERDEIGDLQLILPSSARGQAKLTIQLVAPDATRVAHAETVLQIATVSQPLQRNAEDTNAALLAPTNQEPALFGMAVSGVSPEITDAQHAQLAHESPVEQADPGLREAKPSAAVTEREEEPVQAERRIVQSRRLAPAKHTVANVGTNEVKTSVFVNLRQAPSPSAKVIRVVAKGTKLRVVARKGRWAQVTDPATSAKGWIYTGNANPPRSTEPSAPAEASDDTQPKSDSVWPSFLRGGLASR